MKAYLLAFIIFVLGVSAIAQQTRTDVLKQLVTYRGPIPVSMLQHLNAADIEALEKKILLLRPMYADSIQLRESSGANPTALPGSARVDALVDQSLRSFRNEFVKLRDKYKVSLNAKNTRVYIVGGSMEYYYFRAASVGITNFMRPDQFRFLGLSRSSFLGDEWPAITKYIENSVHSDLAAGRDIIVIDSVARGISLGHVYRAIEAAISKAKSASKLTAFGVQEEGPLGIRTGGGYGGTFGASTTPEEYAESIEDAGWAYYGFSTDRLDLVSKYWYDQQKARARDVIYQTQASIPRFAPHKYSREIRDGFPEGSGGDVPEELPAKLRVSSLVNLIDQNSLSYEEGEFILRRLRALRFYAKASQRLESLRRTCESLFG